MTQPYYADESVTIYHGDCREILPSLGKVDLVLTDPPYSMKHVDGGGFASARAFYRDGALDGMCEFQLAEHAEVLCVAPQLVVFHSRDQVGEYASWILSKFGHYDLHVWFKTNAIPFVCNTWKSDIEYIALGWTAKAHQIVPQDAKSKVYVSSLERGALHPTQKPVGLMSKYVAVLAAESDVILDPYMGSGTTLFCAKRLGRKAIGIEIEERYCEIAANRCRQMVLL